MPAPGLVIFDDGRGRFGPLTDLRAAHELRTGAMTTGERAATALNMTVCAHIVPSELADIVAERSDAAVNKIPPGDCLLVNARLPALHGRVAQQIAALPVDHALTLPDGQVAAVRLDSRRAEQWMADRFGALRGMQTTVLPDVGLIDRPWDIIARLDATLRADLDLLAPRHERKTLPDHVHVFGDTGVHVDAAAKVHPMTVLNCEKGPIVIDAGAIVGSFTVVAGPCYIGRDAIVVPQSHVRSNTVIGPRCVVGGEISWSVLQGYANKCHAGYLGHSLVGEWANLGADTTVSNLKNTYGHVRVQLDPDTAPQDSQQTKLGPIIGDHVRTAIGSRLLTGSCLGTGTMIALSGFAPKCTGRFAFHTDSDAQKYDIDKFIAAARYAMSRRDVELTPAVEARLRALAAI